ncbi:hypothetical protein AJ80_06469 [Polytolypa hystricis UAMH7299]|uniref:Mcm2 3 5 family protein n=1 Tax=Polytolypa hystricis (strain UAMH7299) TaxID=1447883 RepID=A0A2B7XX82_POLH7|nr:hypothetical protein AJ80_06469 [Polytolypa hystricis UAMH7299]
MATDRDDDFPYQSGQNTQTRLPVYTRHPYQRVPSDPHLDITDMNRGTTFDAPQSDSFGLGISNNPRESQYAAYNPENTNNLGEFDSDIELRSRYYLEPNSSSPSRAEAMGASPEITFTPPYIERKAVGTGISTANRSDNVNCQSRRSLKQPRTSWLTVSFLLLAFYSTALSGVYLVVAFIKPRFGTRIGKDALSPANASLISAFLAKTVELSFVTVFVAFLGQVLSRRAIARMSKGVTIAEMSMRAWIMQPGTLITHWHTLRYAGLTFIGMVSLSATIMALLYTTAADALVSPKLAFPKPEPLNLFGRVATKFANPVYLARECLTPITKAIDPTDGQSTCMQIAHVGQAYHNYQQYIAAWASTAKAGNASSQLSGREPPGGTWYDNTTVTGSWIHQQDVSELSKKYGRLVVNVTAAMPHAGVFASSRDPINAIRQPDDFIGSQGEFTIVASVPSPVINVLCVGMSKDEISPLVYDTWPNAHLNTTTWGRNQTGVPPFPSWLNSTVVDDIFGFGQERGQRPPVFSKLPLGYNTLTNVTNLPPANAMYLLGTADVQYTKNPEYVMCALKAGLTSSCSTHYHASDNGGQLNTVCEDPNDDMAYRNVAPDVDTILWEPDWRHIGDTWSSAVNLGSGILDTYASNARLLMQLVPTFDEKTQTASLDPKSPSIAEALAVMAGSTLLMSSENTPFVPGWNYTGARVDENQILNVPVSQHYKATIQISDYISGGDQTWQAVFYVVLVVVFLTNLFCLVYMYFGIWGAQITDFTEPQNTFTLALNSHPSTRVLGACGRGPEGPELDERWVVRMEEQNEHYYITSRAEEMEMLGKAYPYADDSAGTSPHPEPPSSPAVGEYRKLSENRNSLVLLS